MASTSHIVSIRTKAWAPDLWVMAAKESQSAFWGVARLEETRAFYSYACNEINELLVASHSQQGLKALN